MEAKDRLERTGQYFSVLFQVCKWRWLWQKSAWLSIFLEQLKIGVPSNYQWR